MSDTRRRGARVSFTVDPPTGGPASPKSPKSSKPSSSSKYPSPASSPVSRYNSDSGVGSLSDHGSHTGTSSPDRGFTETDVHRQWNDLAQLQAAYRTVYDGERLAKADLRRAEEEIKQLRTKLTETRGKLSDTDAYIKGLKEEKNQQREANETSEAKVRSLIEQLQDRDAEIARLTTDNITLHARERHIIDMAANGHSEVPEMSGANPEAGKPKLTRRNSSKRSKPDPAKEAKKDATARLKSRFETPRSSDSGSASKQRSRRQSVVGVDVPYVEPLGPMSPGHATAKYHHFRESTHHPPTYTSTGETRYSEVPRTIHPTVKVKVPDEGALWTEDGEYHAYPLPERPRHRSHHSSRHS